MRKILHHRGHREHRGGKDEMNDVLVSEKVIGAAIDVHKHL